MKRPGIWLSTALVLSGLLLSAQTVESAEKSPGSKASAPSTAQPTAQPTASQDTPVIQMPETIFDFGELQEGDEVSHDFTVKNVGKATLQIEQVRPG